MENMFMVAMTEKEEAEYQAIIANKAFLNQLISNLNEVYQVTLRIEKAPNKILAHVNSHTVRVGCEDFQFTADKDGVRVVFQDLGYRKTNYNELYEKYGFDGNKGFLSERGFGEFKLLIPIDRDNPQVGLRVIMNLMSNKRYKRNFN